MNIKTLLYSMPIFNSVSNTWLIYLGLVYLLGFLFACERVSFENGKKSYGTQNVVIVVIDGARYSDTWDSSAIFRIPNMAKVLRPQGTFFTNFYNNGYTFTISGHTAITTGLCQPMDNNGNEYPKNPSLFQYWLKHTGKPATCAWIIASKGKLNVLANTQHSDWKNTYQPLTNCGINNTGQGYRNDSLTFAEAIRIFKEHQPNLVLINFKEPDASGHSGNWDTYLKGISASDKYVGQLWDFLQKDEFYKNKTAVFITNDHGRHTNDFISHGDECEGCQHISLLALGPDFAKGKTVNKRYNQTDISATIAELLGFNFNVTQGKKIEELLSL
ncbi:MAG: alkaline phosphatase family protein [Bacteroidota bacterium]|nr:alkaline phosphatase family protein [Bacteroidota bacterium]